jgi:hypothetical protein
MTNEREKLIGEELGEAANRLNEAIGLAEEAFVALRLGVTASVPLSPDGGQRLRFGKRAGGWQLLVESPEGESRLIHTSRETRVLAVGRLDGLFDALVEVAHSDLAATEAAVANARMFAESLRGKEVSRRRESIIGA